VIAANGEKSNDFECPGHSLDETWSVEEAVGKHTIDAHYCEGVLHGVSFWSSVRDDYLFKIPTGSGCPVEVSRKLKTWDGEVLMGFRGDLKDI